MRVMIASDLHKPTINGIATFGHNLAKGLAAAGHEVLVVAPSQTGKRYEETDPEGYLLARTSSIIFPFYQNLRISASPTREIKRIARNFKPDIIHVQTPLGVGLGAVAAAKKYKLPLVATNHSMSENLVDNLKLLAPFTKQIDFILREYGNRFYNHADFVTLPTEAAVKMLRNNSFSKPYKAISNGIDLSQFQPGRAEAGFYEQFNIPTDKPIVLYLGRLDAEKHVSILVRAVHKLLPTTDLHLVVAGFGNDLERLRDLARDLDMTGAATFTGRVDEAVKNQFYKAATLFAMPSPAELQSIVTLEAMASGLPVVAVNAGAVYELCQDGRNGYLYELDNVDDLAVKIKSVLTDQNLAAKMGAESLKIAHEHDLDETIRRFERLYAQVIAAKE